MNERHVSLEEVKEALMEPVEIAYDRSNDVYLALGANGVAVVYAYRGSCYEIVTVLREHEYMHLTRRLGRRRYRIIYAAP